MKVLFQSRKTLFTAPGGDTTQVLKTREFLEKLGVSVDVSIELQPDVSGYDIIHVFNLMRPQDLYLQVENAKKYGKKVALSTIYGPYTEYEKKARGGFLQFINKFLSITQIEYLKVLARAVLNQEFSKGTLLYLLHGHKKLQQKIIRMVDVFLPNSESEMERVIFDFNIKKCNYISVPNAVDIDKFDYNSVAVNNDINRFKDCVLCVSRIEGRKNQLNVIKAIKGLPYKFVFIGQAGANFKKYYEKCKKISGDNVFFLGQIEHEQLPQFYKVAKVHVLASWMETPGLSSLEAGVMKTNIVVTKKGDTFDYFKDYAFYCEPDNLDSIRNAIIQAFETPYDISFEKHICENFKWENTAEATLKGYKIILNE